MKRIHRVALHGLSSTAVRLLAVGAVVSAFCLNGDVHAQASALRGKVVVDGSSTVYPITEAAAAAFRETYPNVNVTVAISGTGGGFKRFVKGETDISDASRPIKPAEFEAARANGIAFIELPVALDGLSVVVNQANDWVTQLRVEDLQTIYLEGSLEGNQEVRWSDLNPAWPQVPIKVYSPGTDSGTFDYFKEVVVPKGGSLRPDMSTSEDDNVLVTGIAGDRYSIGYFGASYYYENRDKLKAVPIVNPATGQAILPEPEHVIGGAYAPLSRPLFIYVNAHSLSRPEVRTFVQFYADHASEFATQVQYVAIPEEIADRARDFLRQRSVGTTYLTPDLKKREGGLRLIYQRDNLVGAR